MSYLTFFFSIRFFLGRISTERLVLTFCYTRVVDSVEKTTRDCSRRFLGFLGVLEIGVIWIMCSL